MKKLKNILIVFLSLLLLVVTLYLLVEAPFTTEGLESYHIREWKILGSGVEMISSAVFYP